jgi:pyrimidine 5'-nucleotidase
VRRQPGRPVWLFDLDNTLHHASYAIFPRINIAMTDFIMRELGLDRAGADALRTEYTRRYGTVLVGLMRRHGIDAAAFLDEVHYFESMAGMVRTERGLARTLRRLPGRKILFTNAPLTYATEVLELLGIRRVFERVIAVEQMRDRRGWQSKPDHGMLRRTLRALKARHRDAVLVEDTRSHLKAYRRTGLKTVWMVGHLHGPRGAQVLAQAFDAQRAGALVGAPAGRQASGQKASGQQEAGRQIGGAGATSDAGVAEGATMGPDATHPSVDASGGHAQRRGESGRPHYIDRRIRSIKSL